MDDPPSDRCGYTWPSNHNINDEPNHQNCCYRESLADANYCAWHADYPNEVNEDSIAVLESARAPLEIRSQNEPYNELIDGAKLGNIDSSDRDIYDHCLDFTKVALRDSKFNGSNLCGCEFLYADLTNANLSCAHLSNARFRDTCLTGANLFGARASDSHFKLANLSDANLHGANFDNSNLYIADLSGTNLLGTKLREANLKRADIRRAGIKKTRLENVEVDQETKMDAPSKWEIEADDNVEGRILDAFCFWNRIGSDPDNKLKDAEKQYRRLQRLRKRNDLSESVTLILREKNARRKRALAERDYWSWAKSAFHRWTLGYGERIRYVIVTSILLMFLFGLVYPFVGGVEIDQQEQIVYSFGEISIFGGAMPGWVETLWANLYFSIVSFSTLGYGDIQPANSLVQALASFQSLIGAILIAFLVFVLGRQSTR